VDAVSLEELWRASVPGASAHQVLPDAIDRAVVVADGSGVAYAARRLRRLSLDTGRELASVRTRHQSVGALALVAGRLWVATDRRLFALDRRSLDVLAQWDKGLVQYTHTIVPLGDRLVLANWLTPTVGLFDPATGATRRLRVGVQPVVLAGSGRVRLIAGFDGGVATLRPDGRLTDRRPTPPVRAATSLAGGTAWAVLAGPPKGGEGEPPVWHRPGTPTVVSLDGEQYTVQLPAPCEALYPDAVPARLWCALGARSGRADQLALLDTGQHRVVASYALPAGCHLRQISAGTGLAFAVLPDPSQDRAELIAYRLPR
jgi:hypothetical protein